MKTVFCCVICFMLSIYLSSPARPAVSPFIAGPSDTDSVWVTVSVNDTLGNAANADTLELIWLHEGVSYDTTVITTAGQSTGQYVQSHVASDEGALGAYQVLVRARVSGRTPITNYAYTVTLDDPCAGGGPVACTLNVLRAHGSDTNAVMDATLRVYNSDETATVAVGTTDLNGRAIFHLPTDVLYVVGAHTSYTITPDTVVVDYDGTSDTLWATAFDPGAPASPNLCRVYGWVIGVAGDTIVDASVHARIIQAPLQYQNVIVSPYPVTTATDSAGFWYLDVIPSSQLTPDTTRYEFTIRYPSGAILRRSVAVPDSTEWLLTW